MRLAYVTTSSADAKRLADFYATLLGLAITYSEPPYVVIGSTTPGPTLAFQQVASPVGPGRTHIDLSVLDLDEACEAILAAGGAIGDWYGENGSVWRQARDPDGNVFCLLLRQPDPGTGELASGT